MLPDLAGSYDNLGNTLRRQSWLEAAIHSLQEAVKHGKNWYVQRYAWWREETLLERWMRLCEWLVEDGRFPEAEDELWRAAKRLPHMQDLLPKGTQLYDLMLQVSDQALEDADLPREEVKMGKREFIEQFAPYQSPFWQGQLNRIEHRLTIHEDVERAQRELEAVVSTWERTEPRVHLRHAEFLRNHVDDADAAYDAAVRGAEEARRHLREDEGRGDDERQTLLEVLLAALRLAARVGLTEDVSASVRQERQFDLRGFRDVPSGLSDLVTDEFEEAWEGLQMAIEDGFAGDLEYAAWLQEAYASKLEGLLDDRWADVKDQFAEVARERAHGDLSDAEATQRISEVGMQLDYSKEMKRERSDQREYLMERLRVDPQRRTELRPALTALTAKSLLEDDPTTPKVVLAMMGTAVEGAVRTVLVEPYLDAIEEGSARRISLDPYPEALHACFEGDRPFTLGLLGMVWGRLVKYWTEEPKSAALAEWVEDTFENPELLHDERLNVLDEIRTLCNKGPHYQEREAQPKDLDRMLDLTVEDSPSLLPCLYQARHG